MIRSYGYELPLSEAPAVSTGRWLPRQWPMVVEVSNETEAPARTQAVSTARCAFDGSTAL